MSTQPEGVWQLVNTNAFHISPENAVVLLAFMIIPPSMQMQETATTRAERPIKGQPPISLGLQCDPSNLDHSGEDHCFFIQYFLAEYAVCTLSDAVSITCFITSPLSRGT